MGRRLAGGVGVLRSGDLGLRSRRVLGGGNGSGMTFRLVEPDLGATGGDEDPGLRPGDDLEVAFPAMMRDSPADREAGGS